jgi:hypothetical protein
LLNTKSIATTSILFELAWKKQKTTIENDILEKFNTIEVFDRNNKLVDANTINLGYLVSINC